MYDSATGTVTVRSHPIEISEVNFQVSVIASGIFIGIGSVLASLRPAPSSSLP